MLLQSVGRVLEQMAKLGGYEVGRCPMGAFLQSRVAGAAANSQQSELQQMTQRRRAVRAQSASQLKLCCFNAHEDLGKNAPLSSLSFFFRPLAIVDPRPICPQS